MEMGEIIKELRIKNDLTMEQLADRLGVGKSAVNKWEKGYVTNIKRPTIKKMAEIFGVSPAYLMGYETFDTAEQFEKAWNDAGGGRHPIDLTDEEYTMVVNYRCCDEALKDTVRRMLAYQSKMRESK